MTTPQMRAGFFFTAVLLTLALLGMSTFLGKDEQRVFTPFETPSNVYDRPVEVVVGKGKLKKDYIQKHLNAAKKYGVGSLKNTAAIDKKFEEGTLVKVFTDKGYRLSTMTHSYPYLTKEAVLVLRTLGESFYSASGNGSYFTVTSLTRTEQTQKALRKHNRNAARNKSSHCYGVSFDISYIRYNGKRGWNADLTQKLEAILAKLQKDGKIYVVRESKQSCFHVTVRS